MEPHAGVRLRLTYKGAVFTVDRESSTVTMGRGRENSIVVQAWKASRHHATVTLEDAFPGKAMPGARFTVRFTNTQA